MAKAVKKKEVRGGSEFGYIIGISVIVVSLINFAPLLTIIGVNILFLVRWNDNRLICSECHYPVQLLPLPGSERTFDGGRFSSLVESLFKGLGRWWNRPISAEPLERKANWMLPDKCSMCKEPFEAQE